MAQRNVGIIYLSLLKFVFVDFIVNVDVTFAYKYGINHIYFIPSSEFNAYLKQIKIILSAVKKYRIFSLVMNTIYIFSLLQTEAFRQFGA